LIKPIAAYQIREERCLIFPWADGGNLCDYWAGSKEDSGELESLKWIVLQFVGISSALEELHRDNCRHGDLKPENILWFKGKQDKGTLQIADLGLARFHEENVNTDVRLRDKKNTSSPSGTKRYEPPEMDKEREKRAAHEEQEARSRQYDIWSMGCILLELLIWLTYGYQAVVTFRNNTEFFWERQKGKENVVHHYVVSCMDVMDTQLQDNTAYKELLHLVRTRFLVVKVSETYKSRPDCREIAKVIHSRIKEIHLKCESKPSYLAPVRLKHSFDEPKENIAQPGVVFKNEFGLAAPARSDVPRTPQTSLASQKSYPEEDLSPQVLVRSPTFPTPDINLDSLYREASRIVEHEHQEVGQSNYIEHMNLRN
jgi:serine/threonine protein kinase